MVNCDKNDEGQREFSEISKGKIGNGQSRAKEVASR
jgi:hypothetical protein